MVAAKAGRVGLPDTHLYLRPKQTRCEASYRPRYATPVYSDGWKVVGGRLQG